MSAVTVESLQRHCRLGPVSGQDLALMRELDAVHLKYLFFGVRRIQEELNDRDYPVGRRKVQRLMRTMRITALYPKRKTSQSGKEHRVYPYLLKGLTIDRPNQDWAADITYIPMTRGFLHLDAIMDWYSRKIFAWLLSNTLDTPAIA